ncbi:MAG: VCBS repeat-containing protein, partial [Chloroflexi bacterium]|nr:VCBS repeat-containing protein [Chloroflexota bacterium]
NSTLSGNSATAGLNLNNGEGGGAIHNGSGTAGTLHLYSSTITNNSAVSRAGGIFNAMTSHVNMANTVIAGNFAPDSSPDCLNSGALTSNGHNLIGNNDGCSFVPSTGDLIGTSASAIDAQFDALADNGGVTYTHILQDGSPAIDSGDPTGCKDHSNAVLSIDQRGVNRHIDLGGGARCDIGAIEAELTLVKNDFNGDSKSDILIRNTTNGFLAMYEMDGNSKTLKSVGGMPASYAVKGVGDFNGDSKSDILIRNITNGFLAMYEMDGNSKTLKLIGGMPTSYAVRGVGDFNGDGKADILIRNITNGFLAMYEMNGNSKTLKSVGGMPTNYAVKGVGDFNGDGKSDILIRNNTNGFLAMYEMDGNSKMLKSIGGMPTSYAVRGVGDFNGDGNADILIRNTTNGFLAMYEMDGNSKTLKSIGGMPTS